MPFSEAPANNINIARSARTIASVVFLALASTLANSRSACAQVGSVTGVAREGNKLILSVGADRLVVRVCEANIVAFDYQPGGKSAPETQFLAPIQGPDVSATFSPNTEPIVVSTSELTVSIQRSPCRVTVCDKARRMVLEEQSPKGVYPGGLNLTGADGSHFFGIHGWSFLQHAGNQVELPPRTEPYEIKAGGEGDTGAPFVWSNKGYGVYVDTNGGKCTIGPSNSIAFSELSKPDVEFFVMVGNAYQIHTALDHLTGLPPMFPKWALGLFNSEFAAIHEPQMREIVDGYRSRGIPFDTYVSDFDWKDWSGDNYGEWNWNPAKFPTGPTGVLKRDMDAKGVKMVGIMKPRIHTATIAGKYATSHGFWVKGRPFYEDYFDHQQVGDLDFSLPDCRRWFWDHSENAFDLGVVGWWNDEADAWGSNTEFMDMAQAQYEGQRKYTHDQRRVYTLNRNFYSGSQRYAYATWSGDIDSGFDVMRDQRARLLASLNVGQAKWGMDTGGFNNANHIQGEEASECYARWMEFDAFVPIFRLHGTSRRQPWLYGPVAEAAATKAIKLRYSLLPYIYAYDRTLTQTGIGICRPLIWDYPNDPNVVNDIDAWMFGDSLLVAPIVDDGQLEKSIYLPAGTWTDYFRGTVYHGGQTISYRVDTHTWGDIPVFVKSGAIIPTIPVQNYVGEKPVETVTMDVFPSSAKTRFTYYDDDGITYNYENGAYFSQEMTVQSTADGTVEFALAPKNGTYRPEVRYYLGKIHGLAGASVRVNGKPLKQFSTTDDVRTATTEGWSADKDAYGAVTWVKLKAGEARNVTIGLR